jgi:tetratricopeptide (TPR) repeat protein
MTRHGDISDAVAIAPVPPARGGRVALAYLSLLLLALAIYAPTLGHEFVWDDHGQVVQNRWLHDWSSFFEFWHRDILELTLEESDAHSNYYRPLFYAQYLLYYQLFGLNTVAWHALAILHHVLASAAVLFFLRRLGLALEPAWMAAALFVAHPAHGESVSWVAAAFNDPVAATCILLGVAAHAAWLRHGKPLHLALGALGYAGALLLKESGLSMLLLVPIVEGWLRPERPWPRVALRYVPFAVLLLAHVGVERAIDGVIPGLGEATGLVAALAGHPHAVFLVQAALMVGLLVLVYHGRFGRHFGGRSALVDYLPYFLVTLAYFYVRRLTVVFVFGFSRPGMELGDLLPTLPMLGLFYLRLLLWPFGLGPSYPLRYVEGWSSPAAWGSILALAAIGLVVILLLLRQRFLQGCALWFLACVWPVFNITSFREYYLAHQRYLYLACLGLCAGLAWLLARGVRRSGVRHAVLAGILIVWSGTHYLYNPAWATDEALWTRITEVDPKNPSGYAFLAMEARKQGRFEDAERLYLRSIEAHPSLPTNHYHLARVKHIDQQRYVGALEHYRRALGLYREEIRAGRRIGEKAIEEYALCWTNYGVCLAQAGRQDEALRELNEAFAAEPHPASAADAIAVIHLARGDLPAVVSILERGLARHPDDVGLLRKMVDVQTRMLDDPAAAAPYAERLAEARGDS